MKKIVFLFFVIALLSNITYSQVSISSEKYNALQEIKTIPEGMTYEEFLKIQRNVDWKKIVVASMLPGYIHFYADRPELGWTIAISRLAGTAMMGYALYDQYQLTNAVDFVIDINSDEDKSRTQTNAIVFSVGLVLNMVGYAIDWAHGEWIIESERNEVYFKYGLDNEKRKLLGFSYNTKYDYPAISFSLRL